MVLEEDVRTAGPHACEWGSSVRVGLGQRQVLMGAAQSRLAGGSGKDKCAITGQHRRGL